MDRRNFIKLNAALTAGLMLPKAVLSQSTSCVKSSYYGKISDDNQGELWSITGKLCEKATSDLNAATQDEKTIELDIYYYEKGMRDSKSEKGKYKFLITSIETNPDTKTATGKAKFLSEDETGYTFPKKMLNKKSVTFEIKPVGDKRILTLNSRKGELVTLSRTVSSSSSGSDASGCYLTTACTEHQGLADNCIELQTLRSLRKNFMKQDAYGKMLLKNYDSMAPGLVASINSFENHQEIYDHMYHYMICPAVSLIKNGQEKEAIHLYKEFSTALFMAYN